MNQARLIFIGSLLALFAQSGFSLPQADPVPGGVAIVPIPDLDGQPTYNEQPVMVSKRDGSAVAIVGIPLSASPGQHHLDTQSGKVAFTVAPKEYEIQRLTIANKRKVNPYENDMPRIIQEKNEMNAVFTTFNNTETNTEFSLPVDGIISSSFGLKRILNDQPRSPHSGLDIAAAEGTPIYAPASGTVVASGDYFFNGNTILVDHGQGLITMYCHMSETVAALGSEIAKGDLIGKVGQTGRVTGAHLHWSVSLNNARVNPRLFLESIEDGGS